MIFVGKTAARPAQYWKLYFFECFNYIGAYASHVWDRGVLSDINAVVNASSQVLGKVSVQLGIDPCNLISRIDLYRNFSHNISVLSIII
jgi:hypothetical protein